MNRLGVCWGAVVLVAIAAIGWLGPRVAAKRDAAPAIEAPPIDAVKHDYVQLMQKQVNYEGTDDPKTKLSECLDELGSIYTCTFDVNEAAFKLGG